MFVSRQQILGRRAPAMKRRSTPSIPPSLRSYHDSQIPKLCGALYRDRGTGNETANVFAITSAQGGEGASTIALLMARELARHPERGVLLATTSDLARLAPGDLSAPELRWIRDPNDNVWRLVPSQPRDSGNSPWETDLRFVRQVLDVLRQHFEAVILDTGALLTSHDVPRLGYLTDGVVLVVEAGRSTRQQIEHALQLISLAGVEFKGFVLNRRTYPIPDRLYRWLRS